MDTSNYFQEKLETLPDHIRWSIQDVDYKSALNEIKSKYKLHIDQAAVLEGQCEHFILGDIAAPEFINNMFHDGHVSSQVAADILIDLDTLILKKIKEKIEHYEEEERVVAEHRDEYLDEKEKEINDINTTYEQQDDEYVRISEEEATRMKAEGYLEDGSNINDEDVAKTLNMTTAAYLAENRRNEDMASSNIEIPADIKAEKESLMRELESPQKSFSKPLFANPIKTTPKVEVKTVTQPIVEVTPIAPDHQLQNTHIEEPMKQEEVVVAPTQTVQETPAPISTPEPIKPATDIKPITPTIKKPSKIEISNDLYREPIE